MKKLIIFTMLILTPEIVCAKNVIETFYRGGFNNSGQIELFDDNTFMMKSASVSCVDTEDGKTQTSSHDIWGTYQIKGQELVFKPEGEAVKRYEDETAKENKGDIRYQDMPFFVLPYYIIEYNKMKFLFANKNIRYDVKDFRLDNHFLYIAEKLNETDGKTYPLSEFWRNQKDLTKPLVFHKDIRDLYPKHLRDFILDKPINGEVTQIREVSFLDPYMEENPDWKRYLITLNVGKKEGVKPEMIFYCTDKDKEKCYYRITSVFEKSCEGYVQDYCNQEKYLDVKNFSTRKSVVNDANNGINENQ
jgi:hypothetical protein